MILIKETTVTAGKILGTLRPNLLMQNQGIINYLIINVSSSYLEKRLKNEGKSAPNWSQWQYVAKQVTLS